MKYRSQWPTFILMSNTGSYRLIIPKYDVHTSNSLQYIRQNHWTMKYRSQLLTINLGSNVGSYWLIIPKYDFHISNCPSSRYKGKSQDHEIWVILTITSWPTIHGMKADPPRTYSPNMNAFWQVVVKIWTFEKLAYKTWMQCDRDGNRMTELTTIALLVLRTG